MTSTSLTHQHQNTAPDHPTYYYDADYPSQTLGKYPENFDEFTKAQGIAFDVPRYLEMAREIDGAILEVCCGTGRVAIPLARDGFRVTGVDLSEGSLSQFAEKLRAQGNEVSERVKIVHQDATRLSLENRAYGMAILAFNSLLCIPDFNSQRTVLKRVAEHLKPGGLLVLDIRNPLAMRTFGGDPVPRALYTRRNPHNGNTFTRFALWDAMDENHRIRMHGWYDEVAEDGVVKRRHYSIHMRPIFRFEIEMMLEEAGFQLAGIEGGARKEPYTAQSEYMWIRARKR
jgi:SAM-dependent methyltransferase